jgi:hypothetical protein
LDARKAAESQLDQEQEKWEKMRESIVGGKQHGQ